jgi:dihydroorotate dehydrogenase electron transfer subunit
MPVPHRGTIFVEDAEVLAHRSHPGAQHLMRLRAPETAARAEPGQFVHLQCDPALPMRRPFSIMRAHTGEGAIEILYKVLGQGTRLLAQRRPGERLSLLGPIGNRFRTHSGRPRALLLGGGVGIPPMVFLADRLRQRRAYRPLVLMGSEVPFPFQARPSRFLVTGVPAEVTAAMPLLEDWGIASRLASLRGYRSCYPGHVTALAQNWLQVLEPDQLGQVEVFACGPHPMLAAAARLAYGFQLPCQLSLEEYMACAVGGCAGCVVAVRTERGREMKRVCVDGPVFDADSVFD